MQFTIGTAKLNAILAKVSKGVGNSKIVPLTEYIKIELLDSKLSITSTNSVNFITYIDDATYEGEGGIAVVKADQLIKLASKTTKDSMTFTTTDTEIQVKGNGTYKIPLYDTNTYIEYEFDATVPSIELDTAVLKKVFAVNRSSIATEMLMPCLTGYFVGGHCVTTDGVRMCLNDTKVFEEPALLTQTLADLLQVLPDGKVTVQRQDNKLLFTTPTIVIFGTELDGLDTFPDITGVMGIEYNHSMQLKKQDLLDALDRLSIFTNKVDNNGINMGFDVLSVDITDLQASSTETIEAANKADITVPAEVQERLTISLNLDYLASLVEVVSGETVTIHYEDNETPVKITDGAVTLLLSTISA